MPFEGKRVEPIDRYRVVSMDVFLFVRYAGAYTKTINGMSGTGFFVLIFSVCDWRSHTSRYFPFHEYTANFFEPDENRAALITLALLNGPAMGLLSAGC